MSESAQDSDIFHQGMQPMNPEGGRGRRGLFARLGGLKMVVLLAIGVSDYYLDWIPKFNIEMDLKDWLRLSAVVLPFVLLAALALAPGRR